MIQAHKCNMPLMLLADSYRGGHVVHALSLSSAFFIMAIVAIIVATFIIIEICMEVTRELNHLRQHPFSM